MQSGVFKCLFVVTHFLWLHTVKSYKNSSCTEFTSFFGIENFGLHTARALFISPWRVRNFWTFNEMLNGNSWNILPRRRAAMKCHNLHFFRTTTRSKYEMMPIKNWWLQFSESIVNQHANEYWIDSNPTESNTFNFF